MKDIIHQNENVK